MHGGALVPDILRWLWRDASTPARVDKPRSKELPPMSSQRVIGTVKWFNDAKGYGFLAVEGDKVEFSIEQGAKGPTAVNVRRI